MTVYRLRSFDAGPRIIAIQRFSGLNNEEAVATARDMVSGAAAVASFDLWEGERRIEGAAPTMRGKPRR